MCVPLPRSSGIAATDACSVTKGPKKMKRKKEEDEDEDDGNDGDGDGDGDGASKAPKSSKHKKTKVPLHPTFYPVTTRYSLLGSPRRLLQRLPCPAGLMAAPISFVHSRWVAGDLVDRRIPPAPLGWASAKPC